MRVQYDNLAERDYSPALRALRDLLRDGYLTRAVSHRVGHSSVRLEVMEVVGGLALVRLALLTDDRTGAVTQAQATMDLGIASRSKTHFQEELTHVLDVLAREIQPAALRMDEDQLAAYWQEFGS